MSSNQKNKRRKSVIWTLEKAVLINLLDSKNFISEIMEHLGLKPDGSNYRSFYLRIKEEKLEKELNLFKNKSKETANENRINYSLNKTIPIDELLKRDSKAKSSDLKKKLIKAGLLKNCCIECNIGPSWNNKDLSLQLDHINGIRNDNRLENLRILCPNCHSQTPTYGGKNIANKKQKNNCKDCGILLSSKKSKRCKKCNTVYNNKDEIKKQRFKINWPLKEDLEKLVWELSTVQLSKQLGVSDVAISKYCKKLGINKPPRGYWIKKQYGKI